MSPDRTPEHLDDRSLQKPDKFVGSADLRSQDLNRGIAALSSHDPFRQNPYTAIAELRLDPPSHGWPKYNRDILLWNLRLTRNHEEFPACCIGHPIHTPVR